MPNINTGGIFTGNKDVALQCLYIFDAETANAKRSFTHPFIRN